MTPPTQTFSRPFNISEPYLFTSETHQISTILSKIFKMDLKLVDYSESSGSSGGENQPETKCQKIAVIQPVQHHEPEPEPEVNPQQSPFPHPTEAEPEPDFSITDLPTELDYPEPKVIGLSSDSDTVSFLTDTTVGK